jgi:hypothetical protein
MSVTAINRWRNLPSDLLLPRLTGCSDLRLVCHRGLGHSSAQQQKLVCSWHCGWDCGLKCCCKLCRQAGLKWQ